MSSGLKLEDEVVNKYEGEFKKTGSALVGMTLKAAKKDGKDVVEIDKTFPRDGFKHEDFMEAFPDKEGRIGLLKYSGKTDDGRPLKKVLIILWAPMTCGPMQRMLYTSCFGAIKDELTGVDLTLQLDSRADLEFEKIEADIRSKFK